MKKTIEKTVSEIATKGCATECDPYRVNKKPKEAVTSAPALGRAGVKEVDRAILQMMREGGPGSGRHSVGDKVRFPVEKHDGKVSDYRAGTVVAVIPKGSEQGMGLPKSTVDVYHVQLDEQHPNPIRHAVGDKYFVVGKDLKAAK